jgi:hypothetical protein
VRPYASERSLGKPVTSAQLGGRPLRPPRRGRVDCGLRPRGRSRSAATKLEFIRRLAAKVREQLDQQQQGRINEDGG